MAEPAAAVTAKPVAEPAAAPVAEPVAAASVEPVAPPAAAPVPEPIAVVSAEPVVPPAAAPEAEPAAATVAEPAAPPATAPVAEPTAKPTSGLLSLTDLDLPSRGGSPQRTTADDEGGPIAPAAPSEEAGPPADPEATADPLADVLSPPQQAPATGEASVAPTADVSADAEPTSTADGEPSAETDSLELPPANEDDSFLRAGGANTLSLKPPPPEVPKAVKAPETTATRRQRMMLRIRTAREAFRVLGYLGISDDARGDASEICREYEREILETQDDAPNSAAADARIATLDDDQLTAIDRTVTRLEDSLLSLDDGVERTLLRRRLASGKIPRKNLAHYGRLLASRRFPAGVRRDRFADVATHLLTKRDEAGLKHMLGKDKARGVLKAIVGGLSTPSDDKERTEAVAYLKESIQRLSQFTNHEEFFESGFFLDVHGYKVSMRDQLASPEFLYLSVALNAQIHNRVEGWIGEMEKLHKANQLTQEGTPREQISSLLAEQEEAVASIFGATAKTPAAKAVRRAPTHKKAAKKATKAPKRKRRSKAEREEEDERSQLVKMVVAGVVIVATSAVLLQSTGVVESIEREPMAASEMRAASPLLTRAYIRVDQKLLEGRLDRTAWNKLSARLKEEAALDMAEKLSAKGLENARVMAHRELAIHIQDGLVIFVKGGPR